MDWRSKVELYEQICREYEFGVGSVIGVGPRGGWSYIQKVNRVTVSVLHNYSDGARAFSLTVPFDKLTRHHERHRRRAEAQRGTSDRVREGIGFYLAPTPTLPEEPTDHEPTEAAQIEEPASAPEAVIANAEADPSRPRRAQLAAVQGPLTQPTRPPCAATTGVLTKWAKEQARVTHRNMGNQIEAMHQTLLYIVE